MPGTDASPPTVAGIEAAAGAIDPVFQNSPQFVSEPLSLRLGATVLLKVECVNPIRSFKGRGTDYLLHTLGSETQHLVCASAGNFGQGLAYAARRRGRPLTVFAARDANPLKVERMRALGATVVLEGEDFDAAKLAGKRHASAIGGRWIEDGLLLAIAEGAGTIALELGRFSEPLDAIFVPLGNGSLVNGIGAWCKATSPGTRVVAVCASGAPAMERSWRAGRPVSTETATTIADGIAVRVPVPEALHTMRETVDEVVLVDDGRILEAMRLLFSDAGLVVEPAGAAGLAAILDQRQGLAGRRVATPLCGGNVTPEQARNWLQAP